jgi:hypothetical protein
VAELIRAVIYALAGILCQQLEIPTRRVFDTKEPYTLTKLVQYVEGGVLIILLVAYGLITDKRIPPELKGIAFVHVVLAFFWSGGGVVLANIVNMITRRDGEGRL